jgi:hypothetical protein
LIRLAYSYHFTRNVFPESMRITSYVIDFSMLLNPWGTPAGMMTTSLTFAYSATVTVPNPSTTVSSTDQLQVGIVGRNRLRTGKGSTGHQRSGSIQDAEDGSRFVVGKRVMLDGATLIGFLRAVNHEYADVGSSRFHNTQWLIDGGLRWQ